MSISAILTTSAVAAWPMVEQNKMTVAVNELMAHLNFARTEAISRGAEVVVCPSVDQARCAEPAADYTAWDKGWLIYIDANDNGELDAGELLRMHAAPTGGLAIRSSDGRRKVIFRPTGTSGGSNLTLAVCGLSGKATARYVTLNIAGRAYVSQTTKNDKLRCS